MSGFHHEGFRIRLASREDHDALKTVCLQTGDSGRDATEIEDDPDLLGLIFAVPYQVFEPSFAYAIEDASGVCGYILGTPDTDRFEARLAVDWFPSLQKSVPDVAADRSNWSGSDWARHRIHHPPTQKRAELQPYPAHAHIDLLPRAQGRGLGKRMMRLMMERLSGTGASGMHLSVSPRNPGAQVFYKKLGFRLLDPPGVVDDTLFMATALARVPGV